jgi:hypothetical protein
VLLVERFYNELVIHEIRNNASAFSEIFFLPVVNRIRPVVVKIP